jgi:transcriptional regulator
VHPNPSFRQTPHGHNLAFARDRAFGVLALNAGAGTGQAPLLAHVPFHLAADGQTADLHLVRSNPIAQSLAAGPAAGAAPGFAVSGPDGYVSPDWYDLDDQVPTWNYVAVHLRGTLALLPEAEMRGMLDRQSAGFEDRLAPKRPWLTTKMPAATLDRMMRQIVPARLTIHTIDGTWKLNQNKPEHARLKAADHLAESPIGQENSRLAGLMRRPPQG